MLRGFVFSALLLGAIGANAHGQGIFDRIKNAANAAKDKATTPNNNSSNTNSSSSSNSNSSGSNSNSASAAAAPAGSPAALAVYQNYDFIPGDKIIFADDFTATQDGEFPDQWALVSGQGVVNRQGDREAMLLTDGNYARIAPRITSKSYLGDQYTIEYDQFFNGGYPAMIFLRTSDKEGSLNVSDSGVDFTALESFRLGATFPPNLAAGFGGKWHHVAVAVKKNQLKIYVDQVRVLVAPDMHGAPENIQVGGIGGQDHPLVFTNFRIATGGGFNLVGQKFTDAKIITHGINFDLDSAKLRPESMGTLNGIKRILTDNPDVKFDIGGHTDNTGASPHNLTLSEQRADAVKTQLIAMGVDPSRLTSKGYGDTQPIAGNDTPEGRANNRRVEFVRAN